jgi:shikimate dehydrogenase
MNDLRHSWMAGEFAQCKAAWHVSALDRPGSVAVYSPAGWVTRMNEAANTGVRRAFVLGHPVGHSRSPMLHGYWLRNLGLPGAYDLQDVPPDGLPAFFAGLRGRGYVGGNVTVPHKVAVTAFLSQTDEAARAIGAVNTIWQEGGAWVGGNTDAIGFLSNLDDLAPGWDRPGMTTLVLGAGGAARAATYGLLGRGAHVHLVNRTPAHAEALAQHFGDGVTAHATPAMPELLRRTDLLVNTTSLGMLGQPALSIDLSPLPAHAVVCDAVYVPLETPLLAAATDRGLRCVDGLGMLLHQAVPGFARWFGKTPHVSAELRALIAADIRAKIHAA